MRLAGQKVVRGVSAAPSLNVTRLPQRIGESSMKRTAAVWCLLPFGLAAAWNWPASVLADDVGDGPIPGKNEVVMWPAMSITATTDVGTITITAGKGLKRSYTWENGTRSVEMIP